VEWEKLDKGIRPVVEILHQHGFKTFESCQGSDGHCFTEPTIRFWGSEFDCIRAWEVCEAYKIRVSTVRRVFEKQPFYDASEENVLGSNWIDPFNEITFSWDTDSDSIAKLP